MVKTTIKDIAQRVGVSKSLVSMYLNNHPLSAHIAQATKEKIDRAVVETGYRPSITARALKNGKSRTIGLVIGNITGVFASYYASALLNEAIKYNYQLLISLTRYNQEEEKRCLQNLIDRQTDGIIYQLHFHPDDYYRKLVRGYPLLLTGSDREKPEYNSFLSDIRSACGEAFLALQQEGCRKLASFELGDSFWEEVVRELAGEHGFEYVSLDREGRDDDTLYGEVLACRPDFVLSSSSNTALSFLRTCKRLSVKQIPRVIYSYSLPNDLLVHDAVYGAIVHDFPAKIQGTMQRMIEMIEHPSSVIRNVLCPCHFMPFELLRTHCEKQIEQLHFRDILSERDKSI